MPSAMARTASARSCSARAVSKRPISLSRAAEATHLRKRSVPAQVPPCSAWLAGGPANKEGPRGGTYGPCSHHSGPKAKFLGYEKPRQAQLIIDFQPLRILFSGYGT